MAQQSFQFDNSFSRLPESFYSRAMPEVFSAPELIAFNFDFAKELGVDFSQVPANELARIFSGQKLLEGSEVLAMAYAGHQFGHFVPQLGDGRAHLIGEVLSENGTRYDIQLKGSGATAFSRGGDGRSSLGPVIREYLVSEAMNSLGVPTTRALAAVRTGDFVQREESLPGGVFTRVSESHLRVGSFEYFAARKDLASLRQLLEYAAKRHYPELEFDEDLPFHFLERVIERQAELVSHWMSLGFIHGVMNTDNCSVAGLSIDYGPCAFMDEFHFHKVFSSIDRHGRYAYSQQPSMAHWNLVRLADCLGLLVERPQEEIVAELEKLLESFATHFEKQWSQKMIEKLGFSQINEENQKLVQVFLESLHEKEMDYTLSFRALSNHLLPSPEKEILPSLEALSDFLQSWEKQLESEGLGREAVVKKLNSRNPIFIPRNHQVENAIQGAYQEDYDLFHKLNALLKKPFEWQSENKNFAIAPAADERVRETFCGT